MRIPLLCIFVMWRPIVVGAAKRCNYSSRRSVGRLTGMFHAVSFALLDSVNALLIGVVVALGVMLPQGKYKKIAPLLIAGDWFGVFVLAVLSMFIFDSLKQYVDAFLDSPLLGILLIILGLAGIVMSWRSRPGESNALVDKILKPLQTPTALTFLTGFILGLAQSVTSGPFFAGLLHLVAGGFNAWVRYGGLVIYASLALSLPALVAVFIGYVRTKPQSSAGLLFARARDNKEQVSKIGGYLVGVILIFMGALNL